MKLYCIYRCFTNTQNYIYPFQNLSLGFILKIFLKFRKFQPRYSYKIYSYRKKECTVSQSITRYHTVSHGITSHQKASRTRHQVDNLASGKDREGGYDHRLPRGRKIQHVVSCQVVTKSMLRFAGYLLRFYLASDFSKS